VIPACFCLWSCEAAFKQCGEDAFYVKVGRLACVRPLYLPRERGGMLMMYVLCACALVERCSRTPCLARSLFAFDWKWNSRAS